MSYVKIKCLIIKYGYRKIRGLDSSIPEHDLSMSYESRNI